MAGVCAHPRMSASTTRRLPCESRTFSNSSRRVACEAGSKALHCFAHLPLPSTRSEAGEDREDGRRGTVVYAVGEESVVATRLRVSLRHRVQSGKMAPNVSADEVFDEMSCI